MLSFACSVFAWGGVSLIECKMRSLELSSLVHSICMQLHRLIAISLSLNTTQHTQFCHKISFVAIYVFLGVPFSAIHCDGFLFHDFEIIIGKYETPHQLINYNSLLMHGTFNASAILSMLRRAFSASDACAELLTLA